MLPSLPNCLSETAFAGCDRHLRLGAGGENLLEPAVMRRALRNFSVRYEGANSAAIASIWSKHILRRWFLPILIHEIWFECRLWRSDKVKVRLETDGLPSLIFTPTPRSGGNLGALSAQGMQPFVTVLNDVASVPEKVIWGNAGNLLDAVTHLAEVDGAALAGNARRLMSTRLRSDGRPDPLFRPIADVSRPDGMRRVRRICCLRHLVPGQRPCATCPLG